jgi:ABC-type antimicrobial peptide transport system permease subunit
MLAVLGVLLGIPITLPAARWLQGTFFGINVEVNVALRIAGIGFVFVATVASLVPALSALRADPVATLRYE